MGLSELDRAHDSYLELAKDIANAKLVDEIFPIVKRAFPNSPILPRNWRPLRVNFRGPSDLGMKLQMDQFVWLILRDQKLSERVEAIVMEALGEALVRETELRANPFIAAILRDLISEASRLDAPTTHNR